jgi:hypothetical protein
MARESSTAFRRRTIVNVGGRNPARHGLPDETAILAAIRYVENQDWPLALWIRGELTA